jgi:hypothetical protein
MVVVGGQVIYSLVRSLERLYTVNTLGPLAQ